MANHIHTPYALLGVVLAATSCSQTDVDDSSTRQPGDRIEFKAAMPELSMRSTEVDAASLNDFRVSAFTVGESSEIPYFADKAYSRNNDTDNYVCYDAECIWPNNNDRLRFVAFAPSCEAMREAGGEASLAADRITGFKAPRDIAMQFDFVTAIAYGNLLDNEEAGITLRFQHQLSRIRLNAWGNSESFDIEIAGVRLGGVGTGGLFTLSSPADAEGPASSGVWNEVTKGYVEYIFMPGDETVTIDGSEGSPISAAEARPILGAKIGGADGYGNSAMVVPSENAAWRYKENAANGADHAEGMYISVLLRVTDDTPYATNGDIVYPYADGIGEDSRVYIAVDAADGKTVKARLYRSGADYFADTSLTSKYDLEANGAIIKTFGWAALPVQDTLKPGCVYTYTLNYTNGVGLRDPLDSNPGEPIISDRVLVNVEVTEWTAGHDSDLQVPRR